YQVLCARGELEVGEEINFVVPTGNFGYILAGYYAKKMGLPVKKLICASIDNKVLYDFIRTGVYDRRRDFVTTISPSMDILISSNLERLLYLLCSEDTNWVKQLMEELSVRGVYVVPPEVLHALQVDFAGGYASEAATRAAIKEVFRTSAYLLDPHTAVAYAVYQDYLQKTGDKQKTVILSTASPYKFARDVFCSINDDCQEKDDFRLIKELYKLTGLKIPSVIEALEYSPIRHQTVCRIEEMQNVVEKILSL
ncbi:MAG: threonine synthase, partial [Firmicutes bacterium]|nr:threonine synthase [Bacillota bacterium]